MADLPAYEDTTPALPSYDETTPHQIPVPGTQDQSNLEGSLRAMLNASGVTNEHAQNAIIGAVQGVRELGHGVSERAVAMGNSVVNSLPISDIAKKVITGSQNSTVADMQNQEQQYNSLHPSGSVMEGVNAPLEMRAAKSGAELLPYFNPLTMDANIPTMLAGNTLAGATQPMQPGENPLASPITSGVGAVAIGLPVGILNKVLVKGYNSGELKKVIDDIGLKKSDLNTSGGYQTIKDFADSTVPETDPAYPQWKKAKAFVSTIENIQGSPEAQIALRADVGSQYLTKAIQAGKLYATRDALAQKLGSLNVSPLSEKLNAIANDPTNQALLGSAGATAKRGIGIIDGGAMADQYSGINLANQPDEVKQAFALLTNKAAKVDYATLSTIRSDFNQAATKLQGNPASKVYRELADTVDQYQQQIAQQGGGELANADNAARAFYKSQVVPYIENGLVKKMSDPKTETSQIYGMFTDYAGKYPNRAARVFSLISPDGQAAVKAGYYADALAANTDRNGFVNPVTLREFFDQTKNTSSKYLATPEDQKLLEGVSNLVDAHARLASGPSDVYQKYLMARGSENVFMGEFAKGAQQITMPMYYNAIFKLFNNNPTIKRFVIASSKLNPNSPEAAAAVIKYTRMMRQAGIGELTQSGLGQQAIDSSLKTAGD